MPRQWDTYYYRKEVAKPRKHFIGSRVIGSHPRNAYTGEVGTLTESYYKCGIAMRVQHFKVKFTDGQARIFDSIKQA